MASNPTRRVVQVLDFLAGRPGRAYSLSELAREVAISKSTLHAVVESLVDAGYLLREGDTRRFRLGPVLAALGHAALGERGPLVDALRPVMDRLAQDLGSHCLVSADFGDWIVPLAASGEPDRITTTFRVGERGNPFAPPMGVLFLAGRGMSEVQEWLERAEPPLSPVEREVALGSLDVLRTHGFAAASRLSAKARLESALDGLHVGEPDNLEVVTRLLAEMRRSRYLILDFDDPEEREIDWVGLPLLDPRGRTRLALVVLNLPSPMTGPQVRDVAQRLRAAVVDVPGVHLLHG